MRILVTGASGRLGLNLALKAADLGHEVIAWSGSRVLQGAPFASRSVDLTVYSKLGKEIDAEAPEAIINCAAFTNLELAEREPWLAEGINATVPGELARLAAERGMRFIQISTDAVFDGQKGDYSEEDAPNPVNVYGRTKLEGEKRVLHYHPGACVARVVFYSWGPEGKPSLAEFFYDHLAAEHTVSGFTDAIFSPLYGPQLAETLLEILDAELHGVYHCFGADSLSKYAFGVALAREFGLDETLVSPKSALEFNPDTPRALNLSMDSSKLAAAFGHALPGLDAGLDALHADLQSGLRLRLLGMSPKEG